MARGQGVPRGLRVGPLLAWPCGNMVRLSMSRPRQKSEREDVTPGHTRLPLPGGHRRLALLQEVAGKETHTARRQHFLGMLPSPGPSAEATGEALCPV